VNELIQALWAMLLASPVGIPLSGAAVALLAAAIARHRLKLRETDVAGDGSFRGQRRWTRDLLVIDEELNKRLDGLHRNPLYWSYTLGERAGRATGARCARLLIHVSTRIRRPAPPRAPRRALAAAEWTFSALAAVVPRRINNEEVGDSLGWCKAPGRSRWSIWGRIVSTTFFVALAVLREIRSAWLGRKSAG
jgi:hypothetical protein